MQILFRWILIFCFVFGFGHPSFSFAKKLKYVEPITLSPHLEFEVFSYKKERNFTAVEIGFTNTGNSYVPFKVTEIYLDTDKYSLKPLTISQAKSVIRNKAKASGRDISLILGTVFGIGSIAVGGSNPDLSKGLAITALSLGGVYVLSGVLKNKKKSNLLIGIENNDIRNVDKVPPQMTLGGFLYFPKAKKPRGITVVVENTKGQFLRKRIWFKKSFKKNDEKNLRRNMNKYQ